MIKNKFKTFSKNIMIYLKQNKKMIKYKFRTFSKNKIKWYKKTIKNKFKTFSKNNNLIQIIFFNWKSMI